MFRKDKLLRDIKDELSEMGGKAEQRALAAQLKADFENLGKMDGEAVDALRKKMHQWYDEPHDAHFKAVIHRGLVALAAAYPINPTTFVELEPVDKIEPGLSIATSDGYVFNIQELADYILGQAEGMKNPYTGKEFSREDQTAINHFALSLLKIDLTQRKPTVTELGPGLHQGAIEIAEGKTEQKVRNSRSFFSPTAPFIIDISEKTGLSPDVIVIYQAEHPFRFNQVVSNLSTIAPYLKNELMTLNEAGTLREEDLTILTLPSVESKLPKKDDLTALAERMTLLNSIRRGPR